MAPGVAKKARFSAWSRPIFTCLWFNTANLWSTLGPASQPAALPARRSVDEVLFSLQWSVWDLGVLLVLSGIRCYCVIIHTGKLRSVQNKTKKLDRVKGLKTSIIWTLCYHGWTNTDWFLHTSWGQSPVTVSLSKRCTFRFNAVHWNARFLNAILPKFCVSNNYTTKTPCVRSSVRLWFLFPSIELHRVSLHSDQKTHSPACKYTS